MTALDILGDLINLVGNPSPNLHPCLANLGDRNKLEKGIICVL